MPHRRWGRTVEGMMILPHRLLLRLSVSSTRMVGGDAQLPGHVWW